MGLNASARQVIHVFNTYFRPRPEYQVVAFTATQIPSIAGRRYPPEPAGPLYPEGIPIVSSLPGVMARRLWTRDRMRWEL